MFPSVSYVGSMRVSVHACIVSYCRRDLQSMRGNEHACMAVLWTHVCVVAYMVKTTYAMYTRMHKQGDERFEAEKASDKRTVGVDV